MVLLMVAVQSLSIPLRSAQNDYTTACVGKNDKERRRKTEDHSTTTVHGNAPPCAFGCELRHGLVNHNAECVSAAGVRGKQIYARRCAPGMECVECKLLPWNVVFVFVNCGGPPSRTRGKSPGANVTAPEGVKRGLSRLQPYLHDARQK
ncbi:uncharacterized protein EV422DRAFT_131941 [Fimicolochytrium jonesii]|uniref:uncharacterized protein n=1 Tax=Fimicolochytrium jonesii TaxID=1396493 RepID=UPI0022FDDD55|nr:uncharacterized protein EV422DRAFT_131941 [Fimicolochytrium jonesii]KAI8825576.1 hypothetical protein EV422DRAFT_131941 [Fimicolochytrium jonesii]